YFNITSPKRSGQTGVEQGLVQRASHHAKSFHSAFTSAMASLNTGCQAQFNIGPGDGTKNQPLPSGLLKAGFGFLDRRVFFQCDLQNPLKGDGVACVREPNDRNRDKELWRYELPRGSQKQKSSFHRWPSFSGGRATSATSAARRFLFFALWIFDPKSSAWAEIPQGWVRREGATLWK